MSTYNESPHYTVIIPTIEYINILKDVQSLVIGPAGGRSLTTVEVMTELGLLEHEIAFAGVRLAFPSQDEYLLFRLRYPVTS